MTAQPFAQGVRWWRTRGWPNTLPLPKQKKTYPPNGYTGKTGQDVTDLDAARWERTKPGGNICLRLQRGVIGLDVDAYKAEGKASFDHLLATCGPLPPTWVSTSRTDGVSGIRLYRVPDDAVLKGAPMPGIEIVQFHHRYVIVTPSIHPSGDTYRLLGPGGERADEPPAPDDLPELPAAWLRELREHERQPGQRREKRHVREDMPRPVKEALTDAVLAMGHEGGRHDAARDAVLALVRFARLDYPGADDALEQLRSAFTRAVSDRSSPKEAEREWDDFVTSAESIVRTVPSTAPTWADLEREREERERRRTTRVKNEPEPDPEPEAVTEVVALAPPPEDEPLELDDDALYGVAGEFVNTVLPYTPAPPAPLLAQFLAVAGCYYGPRAYFQVGATQHFPRFYVGVVGRTATGRKGDGLAIVEDVYRRIDDEFARRQIISGISSGEGLINRLADPEPDPVTGLLAKEPPDKRVVVREAELARVLAQSRREGNIISAVLRDAWDRYGDLAVLTRNEPLTAKNTHVCVLGHITPLELSARTTDLDAANGLLNRFVWVWSEETRKMPRPPSIEEAAGGELDRLADAVRSYLTATRGGLVQFSPAAAEMWDHEVYGSLTGNGIIEMLMARADPYMLRFAMLYALLDGVTTVGVDHLRAAHALGRYWLAGVKRQWGNGLTEEGQKLLTLCRAVKGEGVSVRRHRAIMSGHADPKTLERVRNELVAAGVGVVGQLRTSGRPATMVWAVEHAPESVLGGLEGDFVRSRGTKSDESRGL